MYVNCLEMHTILGEISDFGFYFSEYRTYERVFVLKFSNEDTYVFGIHIDFFGRL